VWKRMGTDCQNQPEVHDIAQALRAAARVTAPALVFKAEAIVGPHDVVRYLGTGRHAGRVSDLAYHNSLMVHVWSALATRDCRLLVRAMSRLPPKPPTTAWATYLRCHDDIGWAVADEDAAAVGLDGQAHRAFLSDFYSGAYPGSFAAGELFQDNANTGDRRISGTAASLAGLERAMASADPDWVAEAVARLLCAHAVVMGFGGVPLLFMGDEVALLNDREYTQEVEHHDDNRWLHRPRMPWDVAERRTVAGSVEARVHGGIRHLARVRGRLAGLHAGVESQTLAGPDPAVLLLVRRHAAGDVVQVYNLAERPATLPRALLDDRGLTQPWDQLAGAPRSAGADGYTLAPYAAWWLTADRAYPA
jgi:amylosucrase